MEWERKFLGLEPVWPHEPSLQIIRNIVGKHLHLDANSPIEVIFLAKGLLNKSYKVDAGGSGTYAFRVVLPVHPHSKLSSEIATMRFIRERLPEVPIPKIGRFQTSGDNELGYEWMLTEFIAGDSLRKRWRHLPMERKIELTKFIAKSSCDLTLPNNHFVEIGSIYQASSDDPTQLISYGLGHSQDMTFWLRESANIYSTIGPFSTISSWLKARVIASRTEQQHILSTSDDEEEIEDAQRSIALGNKLEHLISTDFSFDEDQAVPTVIRHPDLQETNIMLDTEGQLQSVIDWAASTTIPLPLAFQMPLFLEGKDRFEEPTREEYGDYDPTVYMNDYIPPDLGDNEGKDDMYWEHLEEYEKTKLRQVYIDELQWLTPQYNATTEHRHKLEDWDAVLNHLDNDTSLRGVRLWVEAKEEGRQLSWQQALEEAYPGAM